jgi:predicted enzyme related to lactoylglutathione lyase
MPTSRIAHVLVYVSDLEAMATFYTTVFDLRREDSADAGFVMLRASTGADLALHRLPPQYDEPLARPAAWREDTTLKVCIEVDDLPEQRLRILAHGGQAKEPWSWQGTDFCECADPEGNVIQIFSGRP